MTDKAPGCFGIPSIFSFTSRVCGKCGMCQPCETRAMEALRAMGDSPHAQVLLLKHENHRRTKEGTAPMPKIKRTHVPLTAEQIETINSLPKKAGDYLRKMLVRGLDKMVLDAAARGENGFSQDRHRPYHLAFERLLEGGMTKPMLRTAFVEELGWSENAAFSQVSVIWHLFPAIGVAKHQGCSLVPLPNVVCKNQAHRYKKEV